MLTILPRVAVALLVLAAVAFWPRYLSQVEAASTITHLHAAAGTAWLILLASQPMLITARRPTLHRMLGRVGVLLGLAFAVLGVLLTHESLTRATPEQLPQQLQHVYLPLAMVALFTSSLLLAVRWRHRMELHGRYMAATSLALLDPVLARLLFAHGPALPFDFLYQVPAFTLVMGALLLMVRSLSLGSAERAGLARYAVAVAILLAGFYVMPPTAGWQRTMLWFRDVPLT